MISLRTRRPQRLRIVIDSMRGGSWVVQDALSGKDITPQSTQSTRRRDKE